MAITLGTGNQDFVLTRSGTSDTVTDFKSIYFSANLDGAHETPPNAATATAAAVGRLDFAQDRFEFSMTVTGIDLDGTQTAAAGDDMSAAHIHAGAPGVAGAPVFAFLGDAETLVNAPAGTIAGGWDGSEGLTSNLASLLADGLYFNIHTSSFPGGEIRGQVLNQHDGNDRIDLSDLHIGSFETIKALIHNVSGDAVITTFFHGAATSVTFDGLTRADLLDAADYVFDAAATADTLNGQAGRDDLFGAGGKDTINGAGGADRLFGENGNDSVSGGAGNDGISGGAGKDHLAGGAGHDKFTFALITDSAATKAGADVISDFAVGVDKIDLSDIDASAGTANNQAFAFIDGDAFTAEGQVRVTQSGGDTFVSLNTTGAIGAEMVIHLSGNIALSAGDFIL